jgi:hypothetical protein
MYNIKRCDIFVTNVRAPTEDKSDDTKVCFYKEFGQLFNQFPKNHVEIL